MGHFNNLAVREKAHTLALHLYAAIGSASELEYHLPLARDLGYVTPEKYTVLLKELSEVGRMLAALYGRVHKSKVSEKNELILAQ